MTRLYRLVVLPLLLFALPVPCLLGCQPRPNAGNNSVTLQSPPLLPESAQNSASQPDPPGPGGSDSAPLFPTTSPTPVPPRTVQPIEWVGSFNLEWFSLGGRKPRNSTDLQRVAALIQETGVALYGLQEVSDDGVMNSLIAYLPGWKYYVGTSGRQQRCAILWDATRVGVRRPVEWGDINDGLEANAGNLRAPLVAEAKIGKFDFTFIVLHLKAMQDPDSVRKRRTQLRRLRARLDEYLATRPDKDVIIVGDFNDTADSAAMKELTGGRKGGVGFIVTGAKLPKTAVTYMNPAGRIDHVVISSPFVSQEEWNTKAETLPKPKGAERKVYDESISDHLPTWSGFDTTQDRD